MRKTKEYTVGQDGKRDAGKHFVLTEMSAVRAEKWAARALLALLKSGVELPDDASQAGLAGIAAVGIKAFGRIDWTLAEPLMDEMMECVQFKYGRRPEEVRALVEEDIEEIVTRLAIRKELLELHLGFSLAAKSLSFPNSETKSGEVSGSM